MMTTYGIFLTAISVMDPTIFLGLISFRVSSQTLGKRILVIFPYRIPYSVG